MSTSAGGGGQPREGTPEKPRLSDKALNFAHEFLSALFMGLRTAQIHDPSNSAFETAVQRVQQSAEALFAATGGFDVQFVEDSFFLNGSRLRFQGGTYAAMRTLRSILESADLGGFRFRSQPTYHAVRKLMAMFATGAKHQDRQSVASELAGMDIGLLGVQRLADRADPARIDRRIFAVHCYAKLILAVREQLALIGHGATEFRPRIRVVRVVQDLVELSADRSDLLLMLSSNRRGALPEELYGANTCTVALGLGYALGFDRRDLADLGVAALFHHLGVRMMSQSRSSESTYIAASVARILEESGIGRGLYARAMIVAEQAPATDGRRAHPFSRVVRVASAYSRLITGYGVSGGQRLDPRAALTAMRDDPSGWLDQRLVDLLVNGLRCFPPRTLVVLDDERHAVVSGQPTIRWDRPLVHVAGAHGGLQDLSQATEGRNARRIVGTQLFLGVAPAQGRALTEDIPDATPLPTATSERPSVDSARTEPALRSQQTTLTGTRDGTLEFIPAPPRPKAEPSAFDSEDMFQSPSARSPGAARADLPPFPSPKAPPPLLPDVADLTPLPPAVLPQVDDLIPILDPISQDNLQNVAVQLPDGTPAEPPAQPPRRGFWEKANSGSFDLSGPPRPDRLIGTILAGKYRILGKLGEGGMGTVFIANQEPIDRQVAVKVLLPSLTHDEVSMRRFEREAKAISRMHHPNTVTIYDFGKTQAGELYIVMEYLQGVTLAELLRNEGALQPLRATRIIRQVCASLAEAHNAGIVHRDLKPDNIFLTALGDDKDWVKVLDFGLAKLADSESAGRLTQRGTVFGTPRYMSPEQASGTLIDHRSDIYTMGVVLYEMLCGRALFSADTMVAILVKHIQEAPQPLGQARPDLEIDSGLEAVVMRALEKEAENRHPSVVELARELEAWEFSVQQSYTPFPFQTPLTDPGRIRSGVTPAPRFPPARVAAPPAPPKPAAKETLKNEDLDDLLSEFLRDLTPLEELVERPTGPRFQTGSTPPKGRGSED